MSSTDPKPDGGSCVAFERGTLRRSVRARSQRAWERGALERIPAEIEMIEDCGVEFLVRVAAGVRAVQRAHAARAGERTNPFLPYDEDLFVADVSETHVCLLNKFNVVDDHLLIVTRAFESQEDPLRLADFEAPLYNADLEDGAGIPQSVLDFRRLVATHHVLMTATPEYNGFVTPLLLNMLCWASRPSPGDDFGSVFQARPVALMASSPGRLGGVRVIPRLRDVLAELGMVPVPGFVTVPAAASAFTSRGRLADATAEAGLVALADRLLDASRPR